MVWLAAVIAPVRVRVDRSDQCDRCNSNGLGSVTCAGAYMPPRRGQSSITTVESRHGTTTGRTGRRLRGRQALDLGQADHLRPADPPPRHLGDDRRRPERTGPLDHTPRLRTHRDRNHPGRRGQRAHPHRARLRPPGHQHHTDGAAIPGRPARLRLRLRPDRTVAGARRAARRRRRPRKPPPRRTARDPGAGGSAGPPRQPGAAFGEGVGPGHPRSRGAGEARPHPRAQRFPRRQRRPRHLGPGPAAAASAHGRRQDTDGRTRRTHPPVGEHGAQTTGLARGQPLLPAARGRRTRGPRLRSRSDRAPGLRAGQLRPGR